MFVPIGPVAPSSCVKEFMIELSDIAMNGRVLRVQSNGQRRVAEEIVARLPELKVIHPGRSMVSGIGGHFWEQAILPLKTLGRPLWSPSTSGPVFHPNHVVTIHDIAFVDGPQWFSPSFARLYDTIVGRLVKSARHIVSVSDFTRERLIAHYGAAPDRVTTVHSGRTLAFEPASATRIDEVLDGFGLSGKPFLIAFEGTDPRKNTAAIHEAWGKLSSAHFDGALVLFGRAANPKVFSAVAGTAGGAGIVRVGAVADETLACLFSAARGFVFPSLYEGFGLPVIEAAACGCRILSSNVTSLPEVSPPDSLFVDPSSVSEIVAGMRHLLETDDTPEARSARMAFARHFDWNRTAQSYAEIFKKVFT